MLLKSIQLIFRKLLKNLSFWFSWLLSIVTILSSAISAQETNSLFSLFISEKKANIFFIFINFFIVNKRFFNTFIGFFYFVENNQKLGDVRRNFDYFLFESREFREHFFLKCANSLLIRINSRNKNAIRNDDSSLWKEWKEETTKNERICPFSKSTKKKSKRFSKSNITKFENSVKATELSKAGEKISKIKKTVLTIFFIDLVIDLIVFFFNWMIFVCLRLVLSILRNIYIYIYIYQWIQLTSQRQQNQNSNNSLFFDRRQNTVHIVCSREQKNWTYIQFSFSNKTKREFDHFDCSDYTCFEQFSSERRYERLTANIQIMSRRDRITFEISQFHNFHFLYYRECLYSWTRRRRRQLI